MTGNEGTAANPVDVKTRYTNATKLLAAGQLDEATAEFVWLWENMLGLAPHMVGYEPPRELAGVVEMQVVPLLRAKGRWADIGRLYRDPLQVIRHQQHMLSRIPMLTAQHPERAAEASRGLQQNAASSIALAFGALRAAGRTSEAESVLAEGRVVMPGPDLDAAVEKVLAEIEGRPGPNP